MTVFYNDPELWCCASVSVCIIAGSPGSIQAVVGINGLLQGTMTYTLPWHIRLS